MRECTSLLLSKQSLPGASAGLTKILWPSLVCLSLPLGHTLITLSLCEIFPSKITKSHFFVTELWKFWPAAIPSQIRFYWHTVALSVNLCMVALAAFMLLWQSGTAVPEPSCPASLEYLKLLPVCRRLGSRCFSF